jgi:phage replication initiation protein
VRVDPETGEILSWEVACVDADQPAAAGGARGEGQGGGSPPLLTGGESPRTVDNSAFGAKVDWMTFTWLPDPELQVATTCIAVLRQVVGPRVSMVTSAGLYGYEFGVRFFVDVMGEPHHIGRADYGGSMHQGRARLDLFGSACGVVCDWSFMREWCSRQFDGSLTRVDLAVDCLLGEYSIGDAVAWYLAGEFNAGGRMPRHSTPGDWLDPRYGRTLEVGRRENGKMCRVYEKGRQLGDPDSPWVRFELEMRNHERRLPFDMLTDCDRYFAGGYKCLQRVLDVAAARIACRLREQEISLRRLAYHARSAYGHLIHVLRLRLSPAEVMEVLGRQGIPGRLTKSSLDEFTTADSPAAFFGVHDHEAERRRV